MLRALAAFSTLSSVVRSGPHSSIRRLAMSSTSTLPRILSIQSHIVHGFVGNKAAAFPLQTMGYDIDCINTVSLSNHPAYAKGCRGQGLDAEVLKDIVAGLEMNDLLQYDLIMTGYTRQARHLELIAQTVEKVRLRNPQAMYLCDPVLGDNGSYYVPEELKDIYLQKLLPVATIITPNIFETQVLTGMPSISTFAEAIQACDILHSHGPEYVVLTGVPLQQATPSSEQLSAVFSHKGGQIYHITFNKVPGRPLSGCGDLYASLLAAGFHTGIKHPNVLPQVLRLATETMRGIVKDTSLHSELELRIVHNRDRFINYQRRCKSLCDNNAREDSDGHSIDEDDAAHIAIIRQQLPSHSSSSSKLAHKVLGVIFDLDGTLTEPGALDFQRMRSELGLVDRSVDIVTHVNSIEDAEEQARCWKIIEDIEVDALVTQKLRPDMHVLLETLRKHRCLRLALSTRNCLPAAQHFFTQYQLPSGTFDVVQVRNSVLEEETLRPLNKPDPRLAQRILERWQVAAEEAAAVVFVGDSMDDMFCGKGAGCTTVLISADYNVGLKEKHPETIDYVVHSLAELRELLAGEI